MTDKVSILSRVIDRDTSDEMVVAANHLPISASRVGIEGSLVVGRYSVLPYYAEVEADLACQ